MPPRNQEQGILTRSSRIFQFFLENLRKYPELNLKSERLGLRTYIKQSLSTSCFLLSSSPCSLCPASKYVVWHVHLGSSLRHDLSVPAPPVKHFVPLVFPKRVRSHVTVPPEVSGQGGWAHIRNRRASQRRPHSRVFRREYECDKQRPACRVLPASDFCSKAQQNSESMIL